MSTLIPCGEWLPDLPPLENPGVLTARNVIPELGFYRPFPKSTNVSGNTLGGRCQGSIVAIDANNNSYNYAGDASALYSMVTGNSFSNVSRLAGGAYTTPPGDFWEFVQWGQTVIGVNGATGNEPQQISLGAANFADLTGVPPKASHIAVVRDFVVLGKTATNPQQVRWSAINNANSWTADAATLADSQLLLGDGGNIQKVVGGEYGVIFEERAIYRMTFVGSPLIFQFDQVQKGIGSLVSQGVAYYKNLIFFLAENGFYAFDGANVTPIGENKVNRTFFNMVDINNLDRISTSIDPVNKIVAWAFRSSTASTSNGNSDRLLIYNWSQDKWALIEDLNLEILARLQALGFTLDTLDTITTNLDLLGSSLDSSAWNGGSLLLAAFDSTHRSVVFDGSAMAAVVDTVEQQLSPDYRTTVHEAWPIVHSATSAAITVAALTRNRFTDAPATGSSIAINSTGFAPMRASARYHRFRISTTDGAAFESIQGVMVDGVVEGRR